MVKQRRRFSGDEKIAILRQNLVEHVPVSEVCERYGVQPSVFYRWQKELFERGEMVFGHKNNGCQDKRDRERISQLEDKLQRKNEVLSEVMEELVQEKKRAGVL